MRSTDRPARVLAHTTLGGWVVKSLPGLTIEPLATRRDRRCRGHVAGGRLQRRRGDHVEPLAVALAAPVDRVVEGGLEYTRDLAGPAGADRVVVDLAHGHELGRGPGHEDLLGQVQLGAGDVALDHRVAEIAGDLDQRAAR